MAKTDFLITLAPIGPKEVLGAIVWPVSGPALAYARAAFAGCYGTPKGYALPTQPIVNNFLEDASSQGLRVSLIGE